MLSQMSHSAKRIDKAKKYQHKMKGSGFQFLLQSLDRDKENCIPNAHTINYGQLSQSVNIDSQVTLPFSHLDKKEKNKKPQVFIENVKILDCSDLSISQISENQPVKKQTKKYYEHQNEKERGSMGSKIILKKSLFTSKQLQKSINTIGQKNTGFTVEKELFQELVKKIKQYILITNEIMTDSDYSSKFKSKIKGFQRDIIKLMNTVEQNQSERLSTIKPRDSLGDGRSRPVLMKSSILGQFQSEQHVKLITQLQSERDKLRGLVSEHQSANIKMFVKMNEGDSDEIQKCKKQLSLLFSKYKQLENIIKSDKNKMVNLLKQKSEIILKYKQIRKQNKELIKFVEELQNNQIKDHRKSPSDMALMQLVSNNNNFSNMLYQKSHGYNPSELQIDSLKNSRFSDQNGFCSSITTNNEKMGFNQGGRVGINLNALVESIKQQNFKKLMEEPQKLKKIIEECRKSMISMEKIINEQNKELELSIKALQENQEKIQFQRLKIKEFEKKMISVQHDLKKQKVLRNDIQTQEKQRNKGIKLTKLSKKNSELEGRSVKSKNSDKKELIHSDIIPKSRCFENIDQYRMIATQAQALQNLIDRRNK